MLYVHAVNLFNDNMMSHLHEIIKKISNCYWIVIVLFKVPQKENNSSKTIDGSDSVSYSKNCPTQ